MILEMMLRKSGASKSRALLLLIFILFSCNTQDESTLKLHLYEVKKINPHIPISGWNVLYYDSGIKEIKYILTKSIGDTLYNLSFVEDLQDSSMQDQTSNYYIEFFTKEFSDQGKNFYLKMTEDTNFFFYTLAEAPDSMIFIQGKYLFMFNRGMLRSCQFDYFMLNADSLIRVKGNTLPELPCTTINVNHQRKAQQ